MTLSDTTKDTQNCASKKPIHILWVNEAADFIGGCEQYIYNTVCLLEELNVRSTLLYDCNHMPASNKFLQPFDQTFPMDNVKTQIDTIAPDLIYIHRLSGRDTIEEISKTRVPSVRFFHDTKPFCPREHRYTVIGHKTCLKPMGMRCYFPCMGVINRSTGALGIRINSVRRLRLEIEANKELDAFVVASDYMVNLLDEHGIPRSRIEMIPLYSLEPKEIPHTTREPELFLFVGQLIRSKGIDTLLHAMSQMERSCQLVIAGRGRQEKMFRAMVTTLGLGEKVTFLGQVSHENLADWYSKATCVVLPARQPESFAFIGPEAMSYGTPVIATNIGGVGMWLENGETGISVPSNDAAALAHAMDQILDSKKLRETMGQNARNRYKSHFLPDQHIRALLCYFEELLEQRVS